MTAQSAAILASLRAALSVAGKAVTYVRGSSTASVAACVGRTPWGVSDEYGNIRETWQSRDFLFVVSDLDDEGFWPPVAGDRIVERVGTTEETFEVVAPPGEQVYAWLDPDNVGARVHTKRVAQEEGT